MTAAAAMASDFAFNLTAARWFLRVLAGIGGAGAVIAVMVAVLAFIPGAREYQVGPVELVLTIGILGLVAWRCAMLAAGPPLRLVRRGERLSLQHSGSGDTLVEAQVADVWVEPVIARSGYLQYSALKIKFPDRRPLTVATLDTRVRFKEAAETGDPTHTLPMVEFSRLGP